MLGNMIATGIKTLKAGFPLFKKRLGKSLINGAFNASNKVLTTAPKVSNFLYKNIGGSPAAQSYWSLPLKEVNMKQYEIALSEILEGYEFNFLAQGGKLVAKKFIPKLPSLSDVARKATLRRPQPMLPSTRMRAFELQRMRKPLFGNLFKRQSQATIGGIREAGGMPTSRFAKGIV